MFQLIAIYGMTFSSAGLLTLALFPRLQKKLLHYVSSHARQATDQLDNMFIELSAQRIRLGYLAAPVLGAVFGFGSFGVLGLLVGIGAGFVAPRAYLRFLSANRQRRFKAQLVDALLALSSSLRAGLSLLQALEVLAEEAEPPMSQEIGLVTKETRMGLSLDEALKRLKKRMPVEELNLIVTAFLVARETGGDVTEVFTKLIETIRERQKIKERIKTLTVIPRLQGWLMAFIPFVFGMFAIQLNPKYFDVLLSDPTGNTIGLAAVGCWLVSLLLIFWFSRPPK